MTPSLHMNQRAHRLLQALRDDADALRVRVEAGERGIVQVDAGIDTPGSVAAGLRVAEICLGGLGQVGLRTAPHGGWPTWVQVHSAQPVLACLGSQYAGWSLAASKEETGGRKFFALGSGPARALAGKEALFTELAYAEQHPQGVLVMEVDRRPPAVVVDKLLRDCRLAPDGLAVVLTPTTSLAGTTQVVARVLEVALHRAHALAPQLGLNLADIVDGSACAPLPAPSADVGVAMGRTNDAILYGGQVHLALQGDAAAAQALAQALPSCNSRDFGTPFADLFAAAGHDFYKLDGALFAPAEVWVSHLPSGQTWHAGGLAMDLLRRQWLHEAS
jgi:methenyltetrahydromethanopterin cyclohydrolase